MSPATATRPAVPGSGIIVPAVTTNSLPLKRVCWSAPNRRVATRRRHGQRSHRHDRDRRNEGRFRNPTDHHNNRYPWTSDRFVVIVSATREVVDGGVPLVTEGSSTCLRLVVGLNGGLFEENKEPGSFGLRVHLVLGGLDQVVRSKAVEASLPHSFCSFGGEVEGGIDVSGNSGFPGAGGALISRQE